jgi:hypothetical protein
MVPFRVLWGRYVLDLAIRLPPLLLNRIPCLENSWTFGTGRHRFIPAYTVKLFDISTRGSGGSFPRRQEFQYSPVSQFVQYALKTFLDQ